MLGGFTSESTSRRNHFDLNATAGLSAKAWQQLEVGGGVIHKWKPRYGASLMGREDEKGRFHGVARFLLIPPDIQPTTTGVHPEYDPASVLGSSAEWTSYWLADNKQQVVPPGLFPLFPCSKDSESFVAALHNNSSSLPNETRFGETGVGIISCGPGPAGLDARPFHAGMMNLKIAALTCMKAHCRC
jgi:hypothetical protein